MLFSIDKYVALLFSSIGKIWVDRIYCFLIQQQQYVLGKIIIQFMVFVYAIDNNLLFK